MAYSSSVAAQQTALNSQGANLKVDGISGPLTQAAAAKYPTTPSKAAVGVNTPTPFNQNAQVQNGALLPNEGMNSTNTPGTPKPVSKPAPIVSTAPAVSKLNTIQNTITTANQAQTQAQQQPYNTTDGSLTDYGRANGYKDVNPKAPTPTTPTVPVTPPKTLDDHLADQTLHPGQIQAYNQKTGDQEWIKDTGSLPPGYSSQNPLTRTDAQTVMLDGDTYKKFSDGTFAKVDGNNNYSQTTQSEYEYAMKGKDLSDRIASIQNGTYQLNPNENAQLEGIKNQYAELIKQQMIENANVTGGQTIAQNMYGMGNNLIGQGEITKTVNDGISKVKALQDSLASELAKMTASFEKEDLSSLQDSYKEFQVQQDKLQNQIDKTNQYLQIQKDKQETIQRALNIKNSTKYGIDITPDATPQEMMDLLNKSPLFQQSVAVRQALNPDENSWYADFESTGAAKHISLPGGRSAAGIAMNMPILKAMIGKAQAAGISGTEFGQALTDKTVAASVLSKISYQGERLRTDENKVTQDIDQLKSKASAVNVKEFQSNIPMLQKYLQGVDVKLTGSQAYVDYAGLLKTTLTAYARVVNSQTGSAGTSVSINDEIQKIIPEGASPQMAMNYLYHTAIPEMQHTTSSFKDTEKDLGQTIGASIGTNTYGSTTSNLSTLPGTTTGGAKGGSDLTSGWAGFGN